MLWTNSSGVGREGRTGSKLHRESVSAVGLVPKCWMWEDRLYILGLSFTGCGQGCPGRKDKFCGQEDPVGA